MSATDELAPPRPAGIPWRPISAVPDALKDGRYVLLWDGGACICLWLNGRWVDEEHFTVIPTHFAEINPPAGAA